MCTDGKSAVHGVQNLDTEIEVCPNIFLEKDNHLI